VGLLARGGSTLTLLYIGRFVQKFIDNREFSVAWKVTRTLDASP
jgi:hypothetical protein